MKSGNMSTIYCWGLKYEQNDRMDFNILHKRQVALLKWTSLKLHHLLHNAYPI